MKQGFGSGTGTDRMFQVEARKTCGEPQVINKDFILDSNWKMIPREPVKPGCRGIDSRSYCPMGDYLGLLTEPAALAVAHCFLADLAANSMLGTLCVEVRLIKVEVKYSYSADEIGVGQIINRTDGERAKYETREEKEISSSAREKK